MRKLLVASLVLAPLALCAQPKWNSNGNGQNGNSKNGGRTMNGQVQHDSGKIHWETDFDLGLQKAQKENKPIFLYFTGSDWCGWCKKLDSEVLATPEFAKQMGDKFVYIMLDFPMNRSGKDAQMQQNTKLKQQYGVTGFPTVVLLDSKGQFVAETGYRSGGPRSYANYIEQLLKAPQM